MDFFECKVIEIIKETSDTYSYKLDIPEGYTWVAGQHAMWKFKDYMVDEGDRPIRVFTIASAPWEGFLLFTTRIDEKHTSFKEILLNKLKVGDTMLIGEAKGTFSIKADKENSFIIAGGIGITPIRALLRQWQKNNNENHKIKVLYSDDRGEFAYKEDLKNITESMKNLDLVYISDRGEFTDSVVDFAKEFKNASEYLVAGSPGMNKAFTGILLNLDIDKDNIVIDNFAGYTD